MKLCLGICVLLMGLFAALGGEEEAQALWRNQDKSFLPIHVYKGEPTDSLEHILVYRAEVAPLNVISTVLFCLAIAHTLLATRITRLSKRMEETGGKKTFGTEVLRFFGEIEIIFGIWVAPLLVTIYLLYDWQTSIAYLNSRDYTEAMAIVVIMTMASSYPFLHFAETLIRKVTWLGGKTVGAWWFSILTLGPLLGSLITEAGAMMVSSLLLAKQVYSHRMPLTFSYATLGLLFTNISMGGVLTNFASPPVIMVSERWGWDSWYMMSTFGIKSVLAILLANGFYYFLFRRDLQELNRRREGARKEMVNFESVEKPQTVPLWVTGVHLAFLAFAVWHLYEPIVLGGTLLLFLGFQEATSEHQRPLKLRPALLVGFFFASLIIHGGLQEWWIVPLIGKMDGYAMMGLTMILGPFVDNAALTYLASLVPELDASARYATIVGALAVGGLTVIANAPNPAGQQVLSPYFKEGIHTRGLFLGACIPAAIAALVFWIFRI